MRRNQSSGAQRCLCGACTRAGLVRHAGADVGISRRDRRDGCADAEQREGRGVDQNDIIVTARRVEERLQDVPITVTALTSEDLERQGLNDLTDISEATVGFNFEQLSGAIVQPSIRGQTNLRVDAPVQNVAFYLDGVYLQRGYLVDQALLELQRVEVIKGPQSALYGRNAFAGAVNMVLRAPDLNDMFGKVSATVGTDERYDFRGSISVPIIPGRLAVFAGAAHSQFDGTWRNSFRIGDIGPNSEGAITKGNLGGFNKESYQVGVRAKPVDWLTIDGFYVRTERLIEASPTYITSTIGLASTVNSLNCSPRPGLTPPFRVENRLSCGELSAQDRLVAGENRPEGLLTDPRAFGLKGPTDVGSGKITADLSDMFDISYKYALAKAKIRGRGSVSRDPTKPFIAFGQNFGALFDASGSDSSFKGESHEVRVNYSGNSRLRAFFGFEYAETKDITSNATETAPIGSLAPPPDVFFPIGPGLPFPTNFFQRGAYLQRDEDIYSSFAFLGWSPTDQIELTVEGRYTFEEQRATDFLTRDPANPAIQNRTPPTFRRNSNYFTPRATATYKLTRDNNIYASVARGVKSGGLNGNTPFLGQRSYEDETNWTYEIGTKNSFLNRKLTVNLSAFHTDWQNLQTTLVRLQANGTVPNLLGIVPSTVGNLGGVKVYGAEMELSYRIAQPLRVDLAMAYNRSRYTKDSFSQRFGASGNCDGVVCQPIIVAGQPTAVLPLGGNQLERIPKFEAIGALSYDTEFANGWGFFARADVSYRTKQFIDEANLAFVPERTLVNAATGLTIGNLDVQLWVRNLFDKKYVSNSFFLIGTSGALSAAVNPVLGEQRTAGLTGTFRF
jgi:iron complex outermembrane receptor protein